MEVQFGRAKQSPWRFVAPCVFFLISVALGLFRGRIQEDPARLVTPILLALMMYFFSGDSDRSATVRPDGVIQRKGRKETFVPASEITNVKIEDAAGVFTSAVYVEFSRGPYDVFTIFCPKAKKNPERRAVLEEKVATARQILNLSHPS